MLPGRVDNWAAAGSWPLADWRAGWLGAGWIAADWLKAGSLPAGWLHELQGTTNNWPTHAMKKQVQIDAINSKF